MQNRMKYSITGEQLTERFEGFRSVAYQDTGGVWTIAYGHTRGVKKGDICDRAQGLQWLIEDTAIAENGVNDLVKPQLTQLEFDALVDFVFNIGDGAFGKSTMLRLINAGDFIHAAEEFEKWDHVGGRVVSGLLARRIAEEQEFKSGEQVET